jgi:hypothetical protein
LCWYWTELSFPFEVDGAREDAIKRLHSRAVIAWQNAWVGSYFLSSGEFKFNN